MKKSCAFSAVVALLAAASVRGADPWEGSVVGDDNNMTRNTLSPGLVQVHDLDEAGGANDQDWAVVPTLLYHSYEARISGANVSFDFADCTTCAQFERVNASGAILTEDVAVVNDGAGGTSEAYDRSVRWIASATTHQEFVRVRGGTGPLEDAGSIYALRYWDTTYTVPRWNAANGQTTVLILTNLGQALASGWIHFFSGTGQLWASYSFSLNPNAPFVFSTASSALLQGQSGFALIAHTGGYGALTAKAVALEPSTGFAFDTVVAPIPQ
jgi:hypothetical protein